MPMILHIGAGQASELPQWRKSDATRIVLVEPNPILAQQLRHKAADDATLTIVEAAVTPSSANTQLYEYNLPEANSLRPATGLKRLFPGLKTTATHSVATLTPTQLLADYGPAQGERAQLVLQTPGEEGAILKELIETGQLNQFQQLHLYANPEPYYQGSIAAKDILQQLTEAGFDITDVNQQDPDWPHWQLTRHPLKDQLISLQEETATLKQQLEEARQQAKKAQQNEQKRQQQLEKQLAEQKQQEGELEEHKKWQQQLRKERDTLKQQLEDAHQQAEQNEKQHKDQLAEHKAQQEAQEKKRQQLGKERDTLKQQLEDAHQQAEKAQQNEQKYQQQLAEQKKQQEAQQQEHEKQCKQLREERDKFKQQRDEQVKAKEAAQTERGALKQERDALDQQLATANASLDAQQDQNRQLQKLQERMEYLFEQQTLQREQAANALGQHVTRQTHATIDSMQTCIEAQKALGASAQALSYDGKSLPHASALLLNRTLENGSYDVVLDISTGVTTAFLASALQQRDANQLRITQRQRPGKNTDGQLEPYTVAEAGELPKRLLGVTHSREQRQAMCNHLQHKGLEHLVDVQLLPLVEVSTAGHTALFYDLKRTLQRLADLFDERTARVLVVCAMDQQPANISVEALLPLLLQYLASHTLELVMLANQDEQTSKQQDTWVDCLKARELPYNLKEDAKGNAWMLTVNAV